MWRSLPDRYMVARLGVAQQRNRKAQQKMLEVSNRKWNVAITAFKRFAIKVLNRYAVAGEDSGNRGAWRKMKTTHIRTGLSNSGPRGLQMLA